MNCPYPRLTVAVLVTCYNRVATTLPSLERLDRCLRSLENIDVTLFVVDDASPDGTGAQLKSALPAIVLAYGTGSLFWNGGMCRAYALARDHGSFDAYLLFNDDVIIDCEKLPGFFEDFRQLNHDRPAILAGATRAVERDAITYSAFRRVSRFNPMAVVHVYPAGKVQTCDSFNGNFVLVPGSFFEEVGGLDPNFEHCYGDLDLGYVATRRGVECFLGAEPIGRCDNNDPPPPSKGWLGRLQQRVRRPWLKRDDLRQRSYFLRKHASSAMAVPLIMLAAVRRLALHVANSLK